MTKRLKDHTIVCGSGTMAQTVIDALHKHGIPLVILDDNELQIEKIRKLYPQIPVLIKEPTSELSLADANLLAAKNVVAALDSALDNLLIAMTCSEIGKSVKVYARADDSSIVSRLRKAGADEVICPFLLSGNHIANQICS